MRVGPLVLADKSFASTTFAVAHAAERYSSNRFQRIDEVSLFGVSVMNGILIMTYFHEVRTREMTACFKLPRSGCDQC
jgi:hypothetical protein